ncbi:MAG: hypothetical protein JWN60_1374 [Acidobacteria bacterium]|nr:hypothetical protein [Acidobacteriota bacterium]
MYIKKSKALILDALVPVLIVLAVILIFVYLGFRQ